MDLENKFNPIAILVSIIITSLIVGGTVYAWQQQEISKVEDRLVQIEQKLEQKNDEAEGVEEEGIIKELSKTGEEILDIGSPSSSHRLDDSGILFLERGHISDEQTFGDIYYISEEGEVLELAISKTPENGMADAHLDTVKYLRATMSPNKQFILIQALCWESSCSVIYDLKNQKRHLTSVSTMDMQWQDDGIIKAVGPCGSLGMLCGEFRSYSTLSPWMLTYAPEYLDEAQAKGWTLYEGGSQDGKNQFIGDVEVLAYAVNSSVYGTEDEYYGAIVVLNEEVLPVNLKPEDNTYEYIGASEKVWNELKDASAENPTRVTVKAFATPPSEGSILLFATLKAAEENKWFFNKGIPREF